MTSSSGVVVVVVFVDDGWLLLSLLLLLLLLLLLGDECDGTSTGLVLATDEGVATAAVALDRTAAARFSMVGHKQGQRTWLPASAPLSAMTKREAKVLGGLGSVSQKSPPNK